jgi:hypothetical protein
MWPRNPIAIFVCRFLVIFLILVIPWPGLDGAYSAWLRVLGRAVFATDEGRRELTFEKRTDDPAHPHDIRIEIANRALLHEDGSGPVRNLDIGLDRLPVSVFLALVLATPVPWKRRRRALLWGLLWEHCFILLSMGFLIWFESSEIGLVTLSPFWKQVAGGIKEILMAQICLAVPAIIWIAVTFRRGDLPAIFGAQAPKEGAPVKPCQQTTTAKRHAIQ